MSIPFSTHPFHYLHRLPGKASPCRPLRADNVANPRRPISLLVANGLMKKKDPPVSCICPYSSLLLNYARNGLLPEAMEIWEQVIYSSNVPTIELVSELMDALAGSGEFHKVNQILHQVSRKAPDLSPGFYTAAVACFGKAGQLQLMNQTFKDMVSKGLKLDSAAGDEVIRCYSNYAQLEDTEAAYGVLKRSRHLIRELGVRSIATAYIRDGKFFRLGEFVGDVGLGRRDLGNLLWNLLLLSFAVNFKMKSLQREFLRMTNSGFVPDIDTFNIRALAFSRMSLFWDLHLSLQHMETRGVVPDIVTVGCMVDAYLERKLGCNLGFALSRMNLDGPAKVRTDPAVFEAFGKGDFHSSTEAFMEFGNGKRKKGYWSYRELLTVYLKKQSRRELIFWNY